MMASERNISEYKCVNSFSMKRKGSFFFYAAKMYALQKPTACSLLRPLAFTSSYR